MRKLVYLMGAALALTSFEANAGFKTQQQIEQEIISRHIDSGTIVPAGVGPVVDPELDNRLDGAGDPLQAVKNANTLVSGNDGDVLADNLNVLNTFLTLTSNPGAATLEQKIDQNTKKIVELLVGKIATLNSGKAVDPNALNFDTLEDLYNSINTNF